MVKQANKPAEKAAGIQEAVDINPAQQEVKLRLKKRHDISRQKSSDKRRSNKDVLIRSISSLAKQVAEQAAMAPPAAAAPHIEAGERKPEEQKPDKVRAIQTVKTASVAPHNNIGRSFTTSDRVTSQEMAELKSMIRSLKDNMGSLKDNMDAQHSTNLDSMKQVRTTLKNLSQGVTTLQASQTALEAVPLLKS
jgi:hypothetical protein